MLRSGPVNRIVRSILKIIYDMNYVAIHIQINPDDLQEIEQILRKRDIIRSVYPRNLFDQYILGNYLEQIHVHECRFAAVLDRNIFSDIIAVAKHAGERNTTVTQRAACALLAFLQLSGCLIEPGMAIYEYMDSGHYQQAIDELSLFRSVDNIDPQTLVDLALDRINSIPSNELKPPKVDSIKELKGEDIRRWKLHYGLVLKIAAIELAGGEAIRKLEALFEWMHTEYIFSASAVIFGVIYFSNHRFKKMLKKLRCGNVDEVLHGIRNAAWDMTVAHYWAKQAKAGREKGYLWLLCTEDNALKEMATYEISSYNSGKELKEKEQSLFWKYHGKEAGDKIYSVYDSFVSKSANDTRRINRLKSTEALFPFIEDLKEQVLKMIGERSF
jgi:hypothetical protein